MEPSMSEVHKKPRYNILVSIKHNEMSVANVAIYPLKTPQCTSAYTQNSRFFERSPPWPRSVTWVKEKFTKTCITLKRWTLEPLKAFTIVK